MWRFLSLVFIPTSLVSPLVSQTWDTIRHDVYFATDQSDISTVELRRLVAFIDEQQDLANSEILVCGYADHRASISYNLDLSERRASTVSDFLINKYPSISKVISAAQGEQPAREHLQLDRKVSIEVLRPTEFSVEDYSEDITRVMDLSTIRLSELSQGMRLRIENLHFYPGRSRLVPQSIPQLKALEKLLQQHPTLTIKIDGHVCCLLQDTLSPIQPSDGYDRDFNTNNLSVTRAQNIYDYLIRKGIDKGRLSYEGHGIKRPLIQPEITSEDEQLNRRVEIVITGF